MKEMRKERKKREDIINMNAQHDGEGDEEVAL